MLTYDNYLHLFDVDKTVAARKKGVLTAKNIADAFQSVAPQLDAAASLAVLVGDRDASLPALPSDGSPLTPTDSFNLTLCNCEFKPDGKYDSAFHVTELIKTEGLTSVFKDFNARKVALRAESQEDMVDWSIKIKEISQELSAEA